MIHLQENSKFSAKSTEQFRKHDFLFMESKILSCLKGKGGNNLQGIKKLVCGYTNHYRSAFWWFEDIKNKNIVYILMFDYFEIFFTIEYATRQENFFSVWMRDLCTYEKFSPYIHTYVHTYIATSRA